MRPLLLPGLLDAARHNAARGRPDLALFESAHVYRPSGPLAANVGAGREPARGSLPAGERHHLGALLTGRCRSGWRSKAARVDYYALKGVAGGGARDRRRRRVASSPASAPFLHPGRSATVIAVEDERKLGWIGEVHPLVGARVGPGRRRSRSRSTSSCWPSWRRSRRSTCDVSAFPPVIQDIAVVVAEEVPAAEVEARLRTAAGELLARVALFDVYRGSQIGERQQVARAAAGLPGARPHADRRRGGRHPRADRGSRSLELGGRLRA